MEERVWTKHFLRTFHDQYRRLQVVDQCSLWKERPQGNPQSYPCNGYYSFAWEYKGEGCRPRGKYKNKYCPLLPLNKKYLKLDLIKIEKLVQLKKYLFNRLFQSIVQLKWQQIFHELQSSLLPQLLNKEDDSYKLYLKFKFINWKRLNKMKLYVHLKV